MVQVHARSNYLLYSHSTLNIHCTHVAAMMHALLDPHTCIHTIYGRGGP